MSTAPVNGRLWGAEAENWAEIQEVTCAPLYRAVLERVGGLPGAAFADLGCGAGMAAQMAAARGFRVAGLDASAALLEVARRRVPDGDFRVGELEELPFSDGQFDVVTGFNSFQYAGDPQRALREAGRVTRRGGVVVVMTWGPPAGMEAAELVGALRPLLPAPPAGAPGPFALSEEGALRQFAEGAGLRVGEVFDVSSPWRYPDLQTALRGLGSSGVAVRAAEHAGRAAVDAAHARVLARFAGWDGSYWVNASFRCLLARR